MCGGLVRKCSKKFKGYENFWKILQMQTQRRAPLIIPLGLGRRQRAAKPIWNRRKLWEAQFEENITLTS